MPPAPTLSAPLTLYEPGTDGIDAQFVGFTGHAGVEMLVVSIPQWSGNFGYAMRIDASGAKVGDITRIGAPDWPKQLYSNIPTLLTLTESGTGYAIVQAGRTNWLDANGAVTTSPSSVGSNPNVYVAGLAPSANGITAFVVTSCTPSSPSPGSSLARIDVTPTTQTSTPLMACEADTLKGSAYAVAFDPKIGGAAVRIALPTSGEITPLDAQGAAGTTTPFTLSLGVAASPGAPAVVADANDAALDIGGTFVTWSKGTIAQAAFAGPITGLITTPSAYWLTSDVGNLNGPCKQFGSCLMQADATGKVLTSAVVDAHDGTYVDSNMHLCSHPILAPDGAGSGKLLALCSDGGGLIARTATVTDPTPQWVDSWRLPGSVFSLDVIGSTNGAAVQVMPFYHRGYYPPDVVPLDVTGAPRATVAESPRIIAASASGFLASGNDQLVFLDGNGAQVGAIDTPGFPIAATSIGDTGLLLAYTSGPNGGTKLLRFDATGATPALADDTFGPDSLCPADSMGTVLAYGLDGARRLSSGGEWVDASSIALPKMPLFMSPHADCWTCGPNCWLLAYRSGGLFRIESTPSGLATTTVVSATSAVETSGAGDVDHGVLATLDAPTSSIVVQRLTGHGEPDGTPFVIPTTQDVIDGDTNAGTMNQRRIGVGMLDPTHYVVAYVASDGSHETVARRVVAF